MSDNLTQIVLAVVAGLFAIAQAFLVWRLNQTHKAVNSNWTALYQEHAAAVSENSELKRVLQIVGVKLPPAALDTPATVAGSHPELIKAKEIGK